MPSSLVTAFRQQFPEGSLLSEVLTIQDGLFVVRVSVASRGSVLSQALAANNSLELAEDIACNRALERLVLSTGGKAAPSPPTVPVQKPQHPPSSLPNPLTALDIDQTVATPHSPPEEAEAALKPRAEPELSVGGPPDITTAEAMTKNGTTSSQTPRQNHGDSIPSASPERPQPNLKLATPPVPKSEPVAQDPEAEADAREDLSNFGSMAAAPIDLSDIIAQTDMELQRLGWDVNQGREFLEKTYGKRSRHDLTDEELLEFLLYLEGQPRPSA